MIAITIDVVGQQVFNKLYDWMDQLEPLFQADCDLIFENLEIYIRNYIFQHSHRSGSTNQLANAIKYEILPSVAGNTTMILGRIAELPPYWRIINYGGFTTVARENRGTSKGSFNGDRPDPSMAGTNVGRDRWGSGNAVMFPKNPIEGKHYIEATKAQLDKQLLVLINKYAMVEIP